MDSSHGFYFEDDFAPEPKKCGTAKNDAVENPRLGKISLCESFSSECADDPFGRVINSSGIYVSGNDFTFSTKYADAETEFYYYGYRYYHADEGRWINRDPIEEDGGLNIYGMLENDSVNFLDLLGNKKTSGSAKTGQDEGDKSGAVDDILDKLNERIEKVGQKMQEKCSKFKSKKGCKICCRSGGVVIGAAITAAHVLGTGKCGINVFCHSRLLTGIAAAIASGRVIIKSCESGCVDCPTPGK